MTHPKPLTETASRALDQAQQLYRSGRLQEADAAYRRWLQAYGPHPAPLNGLAAIALAVGQVQAAEQIVAQGVRSFPKDFVLRLTQGNVRMAQRDGHGAVSAINEAIKLGGRQPELLNAKGAALQMTGDLAEAKRAFQQALDLNPEFADCRRNLSVVSMAMGDTDGALEQARRAVACAPGSALAMQQLATVLFETGQLAEADDHAEKALRLAPGWHAPRLLRRTLRMRRGDWRDLDDDKQVIRAAIENGSGARVDPYMVLTLFDDPPLHRLNAQQWADRRLGFSPRRTQRKRRPLTDTTVLTVGVLSADLRNHPIGRLIRGPVAQMDRNRFRVIGFDTNGSDGSIERQRLEAAFDRIVDVSRRPDDAIAQQVRALEVDILIDLTGYTRGGRTGVLNHDPAALQLSLLGYAGTLGTAHVDGVVVDDVVVPHGSEAHYTERCLRLPRCYYPTDYQLPRPSIPQRSDLGLPERAFVFACFCDSRKILPERFSTWMSLLSEVPESVLWLLAGPAEEAFREAAQHQGISPDRLIFAPWLPPQEHLARCGAADLMLDTYPFGAHTTAFDAVWMGTPIVTRAGEAFQARVAASLLVHAGVAELVTEDEAAYRDLALALARDPSRLAAVLANIDARRGPSDPFDTAGYTRALETALLEAWAAAA